MKKIIILFLTFNFSLFTFSSFAQWHETSVDTASIYCLATNGTNIFAGSGWGLFISTDNGASWSPNVSFPYDAPSAFAVSGGTVYAGTYQTGVYSTGDNGGSWYDLTNGWGTGYPDEPASRIYYWATALAVNGTNIFAGTDGGGIVLSTNNGASWNDVSNGLQQISFSYSSIAISGTYMFAATTNTLGLSTSPVYLSTNNGTSWKLDQVPNSTVNIFAVSGTNIFAGTTKNGVYITTNNGASWTAMNTGLTTKNVTSLAVSGKSIFAGTMGGGVFLSTNNGTSWSPVNTGLTDMNINALAVNSTYLFAGTISGNAGEVWKRAISEMTGVDELGIRNEELAIKVYPNPVNQQTAINYQLSAKSHVKLSILDLTGREEEVIENGELRMENAGEHKIYFNTEELKSGVYFVKLSTESGTSIMKFIKL